MDPLPLSLDDLIHHVHEHSADEAPLSHLGAAVEVSGQVEELADHLVGHFVDQARRAGASWTEIGAHMGVTKQAAQKRFVPRGSQDPDFPAGGYLSRFTPRARHTLQVARAQAHERGHGEVTNAHLLLGLVTDPDGLAAKAVVAGGVSLDQVSGALRAILPEDRKAKGRRTPFARSTKKTLELALREALRLGHNYIGTEHLLLGLLRNDREAAATLLAGLGVTHDAADAWVRAELDRHLGKARSG